MKEKIGSQEGCEKVYSFELLVLNADGRYFQERQVKKPEPESLARNTEELQESIARTLTSGETIVFSDKEHAYTYGVRQDAKDATLLKLLRIRRKRYEPHLSLIMPASSFHVSLDSSASIYVVNTDKKVTDSEGVIQTDAVISAREVRVPFLNAHGEEYMVPTFEITSLWENLHERNS